ncbi:MAG: CBS domain-containing protein [Porticoccaceae bacterium]|nr:MAG: CBS domain-containing protein [Porticoccaceae bacterium]
MRKNETITHIMSREVESIQEGQKLSEVRQLMAEKSIHHVPIVNGKKLSGIVSFTDMMKLTLVTHGASEQTIDAIIDQQFSIKGVMTESPIALKESDNIRHAAKILSKGDFHSLPVVTESNKLVGIVTSTDLIRYLNDQY